MTRRDVGVKVMRAIGLPESVVSAFQKGEVYVTDSSCGLMSVVESDSPFSDEIAKLESYGGLVFAVTSGDFLVYGCRMHMDTYLYVVDEYVQMMENNIARGRPELEGIMERTEDGQFCMLGHVVTDNEDAEDGSVIFKRRGGGLIWTA